MAPPSSEPILTHPQLPDRTTLVSWARALGFADIGITGIDVEPYGERFKSWLARGFAGDMGYLERNVALRLAPDQLVPESIRVIAARMDYLTDTVEPVDILNDATKAYISRYALGRDYHKVLRRRLARLAGQIDAAIQGLVPPNRVPHRYRAFTDSAPVLEKPLAAQAQLGWMGKHTLILNKHAGSWFFLGEIFTNAPLPLDPPADDVSSCGKCTACMTVCPTNAIVDAHTLDARRCIAYLTIEHKGAIPKELRKAMGNRVFGCDDCQLFCPWNRDAPTTAEADFVPRHNLDQADLVTLFALDEAGFLKITEGSAIRRINFEQWQRNLAVAIGNGPPTREALELLRNKRINASPMVQEHIDWALQQLAQHG